MAHFLSNTLVILAASRTVFFFEVPLDLEITDRALLALEC